MKTAVDATYERAIMALAQQIHSRNVEIGQLREEIARNMGEYQDLLDRYDTLLGQQLLTVAGLCADARRN